MKNKMDILTR